MTPPEETTRDDDRFPTQQLFILALCRFAEPIAFTSILAYIYVFTLDLRRDDEANAPFFAGLLVSAFALAEAATCVMWGSISDRYGRKPIILIGLAGTALSSLIFGFAQNYWIGLAARVVGGALNGNVAVIQTMVSEMVKNPDHEPRAYSVMPFVWSAGSILGAAMGGYLAQPSKSFPSIFPADGLFGKYPYLLPNLVASAYIVFAIVVGLIFLRETNPCSGLKPHTQEDVCQASAEETALLRPRSSAALMSVSSQQDHSTTGRRPSLIGTNLSLTTSTSADLRRVSTISMGAVRPLIPSIFEDRQHQSTDGDDVPATPWNREVVLLIAQLVVMSYHQMAFASLLPVFIVDDPAVDHLDLHGGLGQTVRDVGAYFSVTGVVAMLIQVLVYAPFVERVGVWRSFLLFAILVPLTYIATPFLTALDSTGVQIGVYADMIANYFALIIIYPCLLILIKNATPSLSMLGQVNGLAMAACSGARTFAPPVAGYIYSKGGSAVGWWSIAGVAMLGGVLLYPMSPPHDPDERVSE